MRTPQIASTAKDDSQAASTLRATPAIPFPPPPSDSSRFLRRSDLPQRSLRFPNVLGCEPSRLHQMRHHRLNPPAKQAQQLVNQPPLRCIPRDRGLENVRVADLS